MDVVVFLIKDGAAEIQKKKKKKSNNKIGQCCYNLEVNFGFGVISIK